MEEDKKIKAEGTEDQLQDIAPEWQRAIEGANIVAEALRGSRDMEIAKNIANYVREKIDYALEERGVAEQERIRKNKEILWTELIRAHNQGAKSVGIGDKWTTFLLENGLIESEEDHGNARIFYIKQGEDGRSVDARKSIRVILSNDQEVVFYFVQGSEESYTFKKA